MNIALTARILIYIQMNIYSKPSRAVKGAGAVQADAGDPLELFRYRWYNYVSIRQDHCEKQVFNPAVSGNVCPHQPEGCRLLRTWRHALVTIPRKRGKEHEVPVHSKAKEAVNF